MQLDIVTRNAHVYSGEVDEVTVPAYDGEMGILPGHTPLLAVLGSGTVRYTESGGAKSSVATDHGLVSVDGDAILVVVEGLAEENSAAEV